MKDYKDLTKESKTRIKNVLERVHKSGYTLTELRKMDDLSYANALNIKKGKKVKGKGQKYTNVQSYRRIGNQIQKTKERREGFTKEVLKTLAKQGWQGKGLQQQEKELIKTSGNVFSAIVDKFMTNDPSVVQKDAEKKAGNLLKIPKSKRKKILKKLKKIPQKTANQLFQQNDLDVLAEYSP